VIGGGGGYRVGGGASANPNVPTRTKYRAGAEALLASKSDAKLLAAYQCWVGLADKPAAEKTCNMISDAVHVELILDGDSAPVIGLGFKPEGALSRGKLRGTIAIDKLPQLAALKQVRFVALSR
jgi:hypothetical protein